MSNAIIGGASLTPSPFSEGLDVWSRGDGRPNSLSYAGYPTAGFEPADQDFGGCLELLKSDAIQTVRYMGQTPLQPGCYLQISARIKAISGNLPTVHISGFRGGVAGVVTTVAPGVTLTNYGEVVEVSAIVGSGQRPGVDLVWRPEASYGHFGIELSGPDGGIVRIDDIQIQDVTSAFLQGVINTIDVVDYGAVADGVTDASAAFEAADAAANGRTVLVSDGVFHLAENVTFESKVAFQGTVTMPTEKFLGLRQNYDFDTYAKAFGDEVLGFKKAFQALLTYSDHDSLDLCGRSIELTEPIDMQAAVPGSTTFTTRRVIRNGQFDAVRGAAWDTTEVNSDATYDTANALQLTNVTNIANIEVGSLVVGDGVGREIYVTEKNVAAQSITLSAGLWGMRGTQNLIFKRFRYMLDFSGFEQLSQFVISDVNFKCDGDASGVMISKQGLIWHFRDCFFTKPKDRALTSIGRACQGMLIDRCQFISNEQAMRAQDRTSIGFNVNANDAKIRNNRCIRFAHFAVIGGSGHTILGNHWFHGDSEPNATRQAGLILTYTNVKLVINGNYVDNNFIEWTNEHDSSPEQVSELSFGGLSVVGNIFTAARVGPWFRWIVIKPYGPDHFVNGLNVSGNTFKVISANIDRIEAVDDSIAPLNTARMRNVTFAANTFHQIDQWTVSPMMLDFDQATPAATWTCDFSDWMPFGGRLRKVVSATVEGPLRNSGGSVIHAAPYAEVEQGATNGEARLIWPSAVSGRVVVTGRVDNPF